MLLPSGVGLGVIVLVGVMVGVGVMVEIAGQGIGAAVGATWQAPRAKSSRALQSKAKRKRVDILPQLFWGVIDQGGLNFEKSAASGQPGDPGIYVLP